MRQCSHESVPFGQCSRARHFTGTIAIALTITTTACFCADRPVVVEDEHHRPRRRKFMGILRRTANALRQRRGFATRLREDASLFLGDVFCAQECSTKMDIAGAADTNDSNWRRQQHARFLATISASARSKRVSFPESGGSHGFAALSDDGARAHRRPTSNRHPRPRSLPPRPPFEDEYGAVHHVPRRARHNYLAAHARAAQDAALHVKYPCTVRENRDAPQRSSPRPANPARPCLIRGVRLVSNRRWRRRRRYRRRARSFRPPRAAYTRYS